MLPLPLLLQRQRHLSVIRFAIVNEAVTTNTRRVKGSTYSGKNVTTCLQNYSCNIWFGAKYFNYVNLSFFLKFGFRFFLIF
jgi:hypothetical protein